MDKDKRLVEASWWETLAGGKSLIHFSVACWLIFCWEVFPHCGRGNGGNGDLLQKDLSQDCCTQCSWFSQDNRVEEYVLIFSCENSKIANNRWRTINSRMLDPIKKRYPLSKGKGEALTRWLWGDEIMFRIKLHTCQMLRGLKQNLVCTRTQGPYKRLCQTCLWVSECLPVEAQVSSDLLQGQGLWLHQTWEVQHVRPNTEAQSRQATNWRTIISKNSNTVVKVLGATTDFPTWGSGKDPENA